MGPLNQCKTYCAAADLQRVRTKLLMAGITLRAGPAAFAASFGYCALSGHSEMGPLNQCKPYCAAADVQRVRTKYLIADISLGVSLVALAGAGYWLLSGTKETHAKSESGLSVALAAR